MDSDKQGNTRSDMAAIYGISSDQKDSPVDCTPQMDVTRLSTKLDSLISAVCWSQQERASSFPVHVCHQEKPEAERHKDRLVGSREINGEQ